MDPASDRVGATLGEFRVTEGGSASYRIPIVVPPGTAGVQPQLALVYDSAAGDTIMGPGWSLSGASAITRCKATREAGDFIAAGVPIDGDPLGIGFQPRDRFCLDGQRLILVSTDRSYGDADAEYRLESDRFTRIYSRGGNNTPYAIGQPFAAYTGPQHFVVQRRDGSVSEYGNTAVSRLEGNGQATANMGLMWAINRFEDSSGNYMLFNYEEVSGSGAAGELLLTSIQYTGKRTLLGQAGPDRLPYATISFGYTPISVRDEGFLSGHRYTRSRLLSTIDAAGARYYQMSYGASPSQTGETVLTAVSECSDSSLSVCYPPTTFEWSNAKLNLTSVNTSIAGTRSTKSSRFGDIDGDGRLDLVTMNKTNQVPCGANNQLIVYFGDRRSDGTFRLNPAGVGTPFCTTFPTDGEASVDQWWQLIDYNGDGRDDLLIAENPAGNANAKWKIHPSYGRFDGTAGGIDASTDLLANDGIVISAAATGSQMQLADFNGDGLADMVYATGVGINREFYVRFLLRQATGSFKFSPAYTFDFVGALASLPFNHPCQAAKCRAPLLQLNQVAKHYYRPQDYDGDGRADIVADLFETLPNDVPAFVGDAQLDALPESLEQFRFVFRTRERDDAGLTVGLDIMYSGEGELGVPGVGVFPDDVSQIADFNGDGLQDLLRDMPASDYRVCINLGANGRGFDCDLVDIPGIVYGVQAVDVDGNGRSDLVFLNGGNDDERPFAYRLSGPNGRIGPTLQTFNDPNIKGRNGETIDYFIDFNGDGLQEFIGIKTTSTTDLITGTSDAANRYRARDVIEEIVNGYGARTSIRYLPLTNSEVYRPDRCTLTTNNAPIANTCTRNKDWDSAAAGGQTPGRGSPVMDALFAMYVVSHVESDAPTFANPLARSLVSYRYAGAKLQGGGRGMLGFREIQTIDHNYQGSPAARVISRTEYSQQFPFIGMPVLTEKRVAAGAATLSLPVHRHAGAHREARSRGRGDAVAVPQHRA